MPGLGKTGFWPYDWVVHLKDGTWEYEVWDLEDQRLAFVSGPFRHENNCISSAGRTCLMFNENYRSREDGSEGIPGEVSEPL
jgi:hypothetical protein